MKLYSENENYKLYQGNMLDMLEVIEPNTIDSIVTDPPYGLTSITKRFGKENSAECQYGKDGSFARLSRGFMGKEWDGSGIEYNIDTWKKCYEVLKPGGYLLAFGGSRTFHRIACAIEDAGFEIRDTIMWLYGSGFPKSMDISKSLDKRADNNNEVIKTKEQLEQYLSIKIKEHYKSHYELANEMKISEALVRQWMGKSGKYHQIPTKKQWKILKEKLNLIDNFDFLIEDGPNNYIEAEREVIGQHNFGASSIFGSDTYNKRENGKIIDITLPSTDLAKQWQGWGTALKPSYEPIIVARKPFKGSLVDNVIQYGVGGINIDECRVETNDKVKMNIRNTASSSDGWNRPWMEDKEKDKLRQEIAIEKANNLGRFPANTILTYDETDYEEVCGGFPNTKGGKRHNTAIRKSDKNSGYGFDLNTRNEFNDSGSASRYFYCAKASKRDRDEGLDEFKEKTAGQRTNRKEGSADINAYAGATGKARNIHPTVKPTSLMQYLVRLVTPNGGTILDPFNGSGSTGKAVMYENKERNKNYKYIGIELTEEYLPIAKARIEYVCNLEEEKNMQMNIFDMLGDANE